MQPAAIDPDFFPIMAWDFPSNETAILQEMRECGLTVAGFVPPELLDACHKLGLRAIVNDPRISGHDWKTLDAETARDGAESVVRQVGDHPAVMGYYLKDEPSSELYGGLGMMVGELRRLAPGKWAYINLFPNYANQQQLGSDSYEQYIERFIATCRPMYLSYDNYFMMLCDEQRQAKYWENLGQMRAASLRHDIPFWNIVLSVAHFHYVQATDAELMLQMYSSLAFGARGLAWFTFRAPMVGNYRMAPLDQFGNRTETWHAMRRVNLQLQALAPTMLKLRSTHVYHLGRQRPGLPGPHEQARISVKNNATLLVGEFVDRDGGNYVMLVNTDLQRSTSLELDIKNKSDRPQIISSYTGKAMPYDGEQNWLAPGQGMLLKI